MFSVIFDMDGTLLDTQKICIPAWDYGGRLQNYENMGQHVYKLCGMNQNGWMQFLRDNYPNLDIKAFVTAVRGYILENGVVKYKKGAKELLEFLKEKGVKMALASGSSRESVNHHLKEVGAEHFFDVLVCGNEVENGKPAPDIFLQAAKQLGVKPEDCFIFEDSANGIKAGYNANMKCIGVADIVPFDKETKNLMFAEFESLDEGIALFKNLI